MNTIKQTGQVRQIVADARRADAEGRVSDATAFDERLRDLVMTIEGEMSVPSRVATYLPPAAPAAPAAKPAANTYAMPTNPKTGQQAPAGYEWSPQGHLQLAGTGLNWAANQYLRSMGPASYQRSPVTNDVAPAGKEWSPKGQLQTAGAGLQWQYKQVSAKFPGWKQPVATAPAAQTAPAPAATTTQPAASAVTPASWYQSNRTDSATFTTRCQNWSNQNGGRNALYTHLQQSGVPATVVNDVMTRIR